MPRTGVAFNHRLALSCRYASARQECLCEALCGVGVRDANSIADGDGGCGEEAAPAVVWGQRGYLADRGGRRGVPHAEQRARHTDATRLGAQERGHVLLGRWRAPRGCRIFDRTPRDLLSSLCRRTRPLHRLVWMVPFYSICCSHNEAAFSYAMLTGSDPAASVQFSACML